MKIKSMKVEPMPLETIEVESVPLFTHTRRPGLSLWWSEQGCAPAVTRRRSVDDRSGSFWWFERGRVPACILAVLLIAVSACSSGGESRSPGISGDVSADDDASGDDSAIDDGASSGDGVADDGDMADGDMSGSGTASSDVAAVIAQLEQNAEEFEYAVGKRGGALTVATISEPLTFNLAIAADSGSSGVLGYLFEGLTRTSWLTDEVEPELAESWEASEDGLIWTFRIRDGVKWHDGEPFTAHDVEFTFNRIIYNDDIESVSERTLFTFRFPDDESREWTEERMTVSAVDDLTVEFRLPVPFAPFLRSMGTPVFPKHILERHVDDGTFADVWGIDSDPAGVVGTGPFTIGEYTPGERVVLLRNLDYWLDDEEGNSLPYLDEIVSEIVPDLESEFDAFKAGESDVHGVLGEEFEELSAMQEDGDFTIHSRGPGFSRTFLAFNMNPGRDPDTGEPHLDAEKLAWFGNVEFRRAVAHVIDRDAMIGDVLHGLGYPLWSFVSPSAGAFHNPDVREYEYDLDKAKEILDGLGWTDTDGDGVREDGDGNEISFSLVTNEGNSVRETIGRMITDGMREIGLGVEYELLDFGDIVTRLSESYDWETVVIGFGGAPDPYDDISFWHSTGDFHLWNPKQAEPATEWESEMDGLYVAANQEMDRGQRVDLYHRAQEIAAENLPVVYTVLPERMTATRNVFGNTTSTLYGIWDVRYLYRTDR